MGVVARQVSTLTESNIAVNTVLENVLVRVSRAFHSTIADVLRR